MRERWKRLRFEPDRYTDSSGYDDRSRENGDTRIQHAHEGWEGPDSAKQEIVNGVKAYEGKQQ